MLLNLTNVFKPATVEEAAALLSRPGVYPLYGGAALLRRADPNVKGGLDMRELGLDCVRDSENSLRLGSMLTLEQVRQVCAERRATHPKLGGLADVLAAELPETLRNTYTLGDLLVERNPNSLTMTLLLALGVILKRVDIDMHFTAGAWLGMVNADVARYLISHVRVTRGPRRAAVAFEKVARTPADTPIVGAVVYTALGDDDRTSFTALALCGVAPTPVRQPEVIRVLTETGNMDRALDSLELDPPDDYLGSREYRDEMARVVSRRALERALAMVK